MKFSNKNPDYNYKSRIQIALFFTGILFMLLGVWRDETITVLQKAIYICLECIGIG